MLFRPGKLPLTLVLALSLSLLFLQEKPFEKYLLKKEKPAAAPQMLASTPSIAAAMHIAGIDYPTSGTPKNFDLIVEVVVKNTGSADLFNLGLHTDLSAPLWLGSVFKNVISAPEIIASATHGNVTNATILPTPNATFSGNGDLLNGGGMLEPGQTYVVRFHIEVDPDATGAPAVPKMQAIATGDAPDENGNIITVSDESDSGFDPETNNAGWPGAPGGFDDPTPLTECWQQLSGGIACNDLVQVSMDESCIAKVTPDMVLEGALHHCINEELFPLGSYYRIAEVKIGNVVIPDLDPATLGIYEVSGAYVGQTLWVKAMDIVYQNPCWGQILLKDKLPPIINCPSGPIQLSCSEDPAEIPSPEVTDNCDPEPQIVLTGQQVVDNNICDDGIYRIQRTYSATDQYGNQSGFCTLELHITRPGISFPKDVTWLCGQYSDYPHITEPSALHPDITDTDPSDGDIDVSPELPDSVLAQTGSGIVNVAGSLCAYNVISNDQLIASCGTSIKIIRTWTVIDWCTGSVIVTGAEGEDNTQIVRVMDLTAPEISLDPFEVNVTVPAQYPQPCRSTGFLHPPVISDNCNSISVTIMTPAGEAVYLPGGGAQGGYIPMPGLPVGTHQITYTATDACGNPTSIIVPVTVTDKATPAAVCDNITEVSLTTAGTATVLAETFDDGSTDNCCIDYFEVRRMTDHCDDGHDDTVFGPSIVFCCTDLEHNPVTVVFRVYDCYGNFNDCMVEVVVADKMDPVLMSCPSQQRITCDFYTENLELQLQELAGNQTAQSELLDPYFGKPVFFDNCSFSIQKTFSQNLDQCREGVITRTWKATDPAGHASGTCTQEVFVDHVSDWGVEFPADITVTCGTSVPSFGEPKVFNETCEMIAKSYEDEIFNVVPGACYKIIRTWQIINWCVVGVAVDQEVVEVPESQSGLPYPDCDFDGDGDCDDRTFRDSWNATHHPGAAQANQATVPDTDPDSDPWDGFITYNQVIKVIDNVAPVFVNGCSIPEVKITDTICEATVLLPSPEIQDCSPLITLTASGSLGSGLGPFPHVLPGTYNVIYLATDNCNNQTTCATTLVVKDDKKPTPFCKKDLVIEIMSSTPPMVPVKAKSFNEGSFDNCGGELHFSFSSNIADTLKIFTCGDLGTQPVQMWVTDEAEKQDYCETTLIVQDNLGACTTPLAVSLGGHISNETGTPAANVPVNMNGQVSGSVTTNNSGSYLFSGIPSGSDVSVVPLKDDGHLNGVTTFDMVQISKHILNIAPLNSPYKLIAADVNNSKTITTFDLVEIRKVVLLINNKFPNNTSWRFVDKKFVFPVPTNPWATPFPEIISINNIPAEVDDADFVAIKVGDVNNSASFAGDPGDRSTSKHFLLETKDARLEAGHTYTIEFSSRNLEVSGFQFTLNFDSQKLRFQEVLPSLTDLGNFGLSLLKEGAITLSWNEHGSPWEEGPAMRLSFNAKESCRLSEVLHLNGRFTAAEAYSRDGELLEVSLQFTGGEQVDKFELFQNKPNPFSQETIIGFHLPRSGPATFTLTDASGRLIKKWEDEYPAGYNEVRLHRQELPATGVLNYRMDTPFGSATKRMVLIR